MIFGKLFKKDDDSDLVADQQATQGNDARAAQDDAVQTPALREEYGGDASPLTEQSAKKTKQDKKNVALRRKRKKRSNRTVHTRRSFHRRGGLSDAERVRVQVYDVIDRPVITEKAANQSENRVYTFLVRGSANKHTVADAVEVLYGVRPIQVRIAKRPPKKRRIRIPGREREYGMTTQKKKAYVTLREGDTIKLT